MSAGWPPSLPQRFLLGTTDERQPAVVRFQADAGPAKTRRLFANATRQVAWRLPPLTQAQRDTLDEFFITTLREGSLEFDHVDPSDGSVRQYRFLSPPRYSSEVNASGRLWLVSAQFEILP
jgi:hypothetical protein